MKEKTHATAKGTIHYWVSEPFVEEWDNMVFLPGLTADHRLFEKQIQHFEGKANLFVWDAPGHNDSFPFVLDFNLADKARWLHEILQTEGFENPILVGQSMGGYVSQMYTELYPEELRGFVSIDSAPLQRSYMTGIELWMLKHAEWIYRIYPWKALLRDGSKGCATTEYGRALMKKMMETYSQRCYAALAGHGYRMLAEAAEADRGYAFRCPVLLLCGEKDQAGSARAYNRKWQEKTGYNLVWLEGAGHNSNTDRPEEVNRLLEDFASSLQG